MFICWHKDVPPNSSQTLGATRNTKAFLTSMGKPRNNQLGNVQKMKFRRCSDRLLGKFHDQMPQFFHFPNTNKTRHISINKPQRNPTQCFAAISMLIYVDTIYRHVSSLCDTFWFFRYQHENAMQELGNVGTNFLLPHPWRHSQCQIHQRSMITQADDHQLSTQKISSTVEPSHLNMLEQKANKIRRNHKGATCKENEHDVQCSSLFCWTIFGTYQHVQPSKVEQFRRVSPVSQVGHHLTCGDALRSDSYYPTLVDFFIFDLHNIFTSCILYLINWRMWTSTPTTRKRHQATHSANVRDFVVNHWAMTIEEPWWRCRSFSQSIKGRHLIVFIWFHLDLYILV